MKRIRTALCLILAAALLAGCAFLPSDSEPETPAPTDPLTGLALEWQGQRPVAVAIENSTASTTQWGLSSASVVLEALTEVGTSTELCLVYPALAATPKVGPVAAGQDIYWRLLVGQQPIPVQRGGGQFDQNFLDYYSIRAVDALEAGRTAFDCGSEWSNAPLWHTSGEAISNVLDELSISSVLTESRVTNVVSAAADSASSGADAVLSIPALLPQEADGKLPDATAPDAVNVRVCFDDDNATGFSYDADSGLYRMLHADGTPQLDANNGQQAGFDNLLVLFSASELRDDGKTYDYDLSMGGGVWLNGGHLWTITWTQGRDNTLLLYDADGRTMNIEAGTSYIALVTSLTGQELTVTTSSGEEILRYAKRLLHDEMQKSFLFPGCGARLCAGQVFFFGQMAMRSARARGRAGFFFWSSGLRSARARGRAGFSLSWFSRRWRGAGFLFRSNGFALRAGQR